MESGVSGLAAGHAGPDEDRPPRAWRNNAERALPRNDVGGGIELLPTSAYGS
jgi:hypothetical protein